MGLYNGLYRIGSLVGMLLGGILADFMGFSATAALFGSGTALSMFAALTLSGGRAGAGLPEDGGNSLPRARTRAEGICSSGSRHRSGGGCLWPIRACMPRR